MIQDFTKHENSGGKWERKTEAENQKDRGRKIRLRKMSFCYIMIYILYTKGNIFDKRKNWIKGF